jgi:NADH-quinone oxidoreductase subunit F
MMQQYPQVLLKNRRPGETASIREYLQSGGYEGLRKALTTMTPADIRETVKASELRGRGGAGFPTGVKWSFFPADQPGEKYLICNVDEMEPGTYKDRTLLMADPHQVVEGIIIGAFALQVTKAYIFIRYAYEPCVMAVQRALEEAREEGFLGENILGSGFSLEVDVHGSAGRYLCGEETALMNGLEGKRPNPRFKPPFPAVKGLFGRPTTINNPETLANVSHIIVNGADWYKKLALNEKGAGTKLFGLSGHLNRTECFELPLGIPLREIIETFGEGVWKGRKFKACLPGGSSTVFLTAADLDVPMDFDPLKEKGSGLGTGGVIVFDDSTCMVRVALTMIRFYARESCGFCTPCRDGLPFVCWLLEKIEKGEGTLEDLDMLRAQVRNINGRSFCPLAMGAMFPMEGLLKNFEDEIRDHIGQGKCPLNA